MLAAVLLVGFALFFGGFGFGRLLFAILLEFAAGQLFGVGALFGFGAGVFAVGAGYITQGPLLVLLVLAFGAGLGALCPPGVFAFFGFGSGVFAAGAGYFTLRPLLVLAVLAFGAGLGTLRALGILAVLTVFLLNLRVRLAAERRVILSVERRAERE